MRHSYLLGRLRRAIVGCSLPAVLLFAGLAFTTSAFASLGLSVTVPSASGAKPPVAYPYSNQIFPGDVTALRIGITNDDAANPITGVGFTMSLPANVQILGLKAFDCVAGGANVSTSQASLNEVTFNTAGGTNNIVLSGGTIPVAAAGGGENAVCDIDVEVTSLSNPTFVFVGQLAAGDVTGTGGSGAESNPNAASASVTVLGISAPTITKSFSQTVIVKNDQVVTMTLKIDNGSNTDINLPLNGVGDTPNYAMQDHLPPQLQIAPTPNATANCTGAGTAPTAFIAPAGGTTITIQGGTVAAGGSCTYTVDLVGVTDQTDPNKATTYQENAVNTINAISDFHDKRGTVPGGNATASLKINSILQLSKAFNSTAIAAGQPSSLIITMTNASPTSPINMTSFADSPIGSSPGLLVSGPIGLSSGCGSAAFAATPGNVGVALSGPAVLAPNATCIITVPFIATLQTPGTAQVFNDVIPAGAVVTTSPDIVSQSATSSVTVFDQLTVDKSSTPSTVAPGSSIKYTITVDNYSVAPESNISVTDHLPNDIVALQRPFAPAVTGTGCALTSSTIPTSGTIAVPVFVLAMPAGQVAAPSTCTITFWAMAPPDGDPNATLGTAATNIIAINGASNGTGPGTVSNGAASAGATATLGSAIAIGKSFNPGSAFEGTVSVLTITLSNNTTQPVTGAAFSDQLPTDSDLVTGAQLMIAAPADASTSCGGTLTAVPGTSLISLAGGTIPPRAANGTGNAGTCQVIVKVIGSAGSYNNKIHDAGLLTGLVTYADGVTTHTAVSPGPIMASLTYQSALTVGKSFSPTTITPGGMSTVRIELGNTGTGTLNSVSAIDPLPPGMVIAPTPNARTTCGGAPVFTAAAGSSSMSVTGIILPAKALCDVLFNVVGTGGAAWANTIPAGNVTAAGGVRNTTPIAATLANSSNGAVLVTVGVVNGSLTAPGQNTVLTARITNTGTVPLTGLMLKNFFTDTGLAGGVPTGMQLASVPGITLTNCTGAIVTPGSDSASLSLSNLSLPPGVECDVTANVTMVTAGTAIDTIGVGAIHTNEGISNTLGTNTSLSTSAAIGVFKTFTPAIVKPGDRTRLRLTFVNPLPIALTAMGAIDNLPSGMVVPSGANPFTTCTGATVTGTGSTVTVATGSLPAAANNTATSCYAEIDVQVSAVGTYVNTISAGQVTATSGGSTVHNTQTATAQLQVSLSATITKAFNLRTVGVGVPSTVTITLSNSNATALTGAVLTDPLPNGLTVAPGLNSTPTSPVPPVVSTTCAGGVITATTAATSVILTGATIPANSNCTLTFQAESNVSGVYVNTIPAGGLTTDQGVTNDTPATDTLNVLDPPTVNKQFSPVSIAANGTSTLTIVLGNTSAAATTLSSDLVDTLPTSPSNMVIASTAPAPVAGACPGTVTAVAGSGTVKYASGGSIPAGGCTITVNVTASMQGSYNNFIPSGGLVTGIGSNVQPASADLVVTPLGAISGRVFKDNNLPLDGIFNGSDAGIPNVTVTLSGRTAGPDGIAGNSDDVPISSISTLTDPLGNYAFTGLVAGTYTVSETEPGGLLNGITTAGTITGTGTRGTVTPVTTVPSVISNIVLGATGGMTSSSPGNNFAEVAPSSISGMVFMDQNNNGIKDTADTPLVGVQIDLINTTTNAVVSTHTDANGAYTFTNLPPGNYAVREPTQPPNTANGMTVPSTNPAGATGTPSSVAVSLISNITLPPNVNSTGDNFAEVPTGRQIMGRVYLDIDKDGTLSTGDTGIAGVTLVLSGTQADGVAIAPNTVTAVTDANGNYTFSGLAEGTYTVTEPTQPPRTTQGTTTAGTAGGTATATTVAVSAISTIPLTGTTTISSANNFGEIAVLTGTVSGKVYADANNNGIAEPTEAGIPGVTVTLTGVDAHGAVVNTTVTTAANGTYSFPNLQPSGAAGYTITEIQPSLFKDGLTTVAAGNPGTPASGKPVLSDNADVIRGVTVNPGDVLPNYNYGEVGTGNGLIPPIVNGYVYLDTSHDRERAEDGTAAGQVGWTVVLTQNGNSICTTTTDANGFYQFDNLHCPGYETGLPFGSGFAITFNDNGNHLPALPTSGGGAGTVPNIGSTITNITLTPGDQVIEQDLPLDPSGVIYDSSSRAPVAGAVVTITGPAGFSAATQLVGGSNTQTTGDNGMYAFVLQNGYPSGVYTLSVTPPNGYGPTPSNILPPCNSPLGIALLPNPALVQRSDTAPSQSVTAITNPASCQGIVPGGATTTQYYFSFTITNGGSAQILNNHIPLDPQGSGQILVTKTTPLVNVSRGDLVPYTITATNTLATPLSSVAVRDVVPAGFTYRISSASLNGVRLEPTSAGRVLTWPAQNFAAKEKKVYRLILTVGAGVGDGKYVNQGWAMDSRSTFMLSNLATATVNVVPDPTFDCPDVIGKVFDDKNANGYQDDGEGGIPGVRIATVTGLLVTTDPEGRFHVPCPEIPNQDRGSNYVMKLDVRTLPSGYRITTENPRDIRLTRGKVSKLNFGATIHRVVRLELSDAAFVPNTDTLLPAWQKQLDALPETLKLRPSVVRLNYQPGSDSPDLVKQRVAAISKQIKGRWTALKGQYTLDIETEDAQ
jgi:uncharacterized repeat protein (TIGR01451 family)